MEDEGKKWISVPKYSDKYKKGVEDFVKITFARYAVGNELMRPCKICSNVYWSDAKGIHEHLICNGPCPHSVERIYEVSTLKIDSVVDEMDTDIGMGLGNEFEAMIHNAYGDDNDTSEDRVRKGLNDDARKFYRLVKEGGHPLYPECKKFTRLSFIVRLYQLKCIHGFSESAFSDFLELIKEVLPNVNLPSSFNVAKGMIKDLAEFKNFCGTLGRQFVPLDLVSWHKFPKQQKEELWSFVKTKYEIPEEGRTYTLRTIGALGKLNKSRIKKDHYLKYDNDEDMLKNRPNVISVEEFKVLLKYWGDKDVEERARKNAENRKLIVETHTAGRKSFAQIGEKIKAEKKIDPKKLAPKDDIYQKTHKRKQGQEYKATTAVEDGSGAEQGKKPKHGPNWLLGRSGKCRKTMKAQQPILCSSSTPAIDSDDLKKTIKEEIMAKMQEMVDQKVCEKMSKVIAKLGEINPDFKYLDVEELCADTTTGDESEDSDQEDNDREDDDDRDDDDDHDDDENDD